MIKIILLILTISYIFSYHMSEEEIQETINEKTVSCGSSLRIQNDLTKYFLSSFSMNWSTGSKLQAVTAVKENNKRESLFIIKEAHGESPCENGSLIKCDMKIRLEHAATGKNLHSHEFSSFISSSQEACGFGENGEGDVNDDFIISCYKSQEDIIKGKTTFFLQHVATGKYLYINYKTSMFNDRNCRGCPVVGQREVALTSTKDKQCLWRIAGGIIFSNPNDVSEKNKKDEEPGENDGDL